MEDILNQHGNLFKQTNAQYEDVLEIVFDLSELTRRLFRIFANTFRDTYGKFPFHTPVLSCVDQRMLRQALVVGERKGQIKPQFIRQVSIHSLVSLHPRSHHLLVTADLLMQQLESPDGSGLSNLTSVVKAMMNPAYTHRRILPLLQASGTGKTKACVELTKTISAVYLPLASSSAHCDIPIVAQEFLKCARSCALQTSELSVVMKRLLYSLTSAAQYYSSALDLHNAQFQTGEFYSRAYSAWIEAENLSSPQLSWCDTQDIAVSVPIHESIPMKSAMKSPHSSPLIVIFDEIVVLSTRHNNFPSAATTDQSRDSPIRCLLRRIEAFKPCLIGIILSTTSNLNTVVPGHVGSDRDMGVRTKDTSPLIDFIFMDLARTHHLCSHVFAMGRPLWYASYARLQDWTEVVLYAQKLLLGVERRSRMIAHETVDNDGLLALVLCRHSMGLRSSKADSFMCNHLALLVELGEEGTTLRSKYLSEPILAEASAHATTFGDANTSMDAVLGALVAHNCLSLVDVNVGDVGELAAAVALTHSIDMLRCKDLKGHPYNANVVGYSLSSVVRAVDFARAILPSCDPQVAKSLGNFLRSYKVNFTHFVRVPKSRSRKSYH